MLSENNIKERVLQFVYSNIGCSPIQVAQDIVPIAECQLDIPALLETLVHAGDLIEIQFATGKGYYSSLLFPNGNDLDISSSDGETIVFYNDVKVKSFKSRTRLTIVRN